MKKKIINTFPVANILLELWRKYYIFHGLLNVFEYHFYGTSIKQSASHN